MTNDDIDRLRGLLEKATPGPWEASGRRVRDDRGDLVALADSGENGAAADAVLIAAAVSHLPALLAEVEALRALRDAVDAWRDAHETHDVLCGEHPDSGGHDPQRLWAAGSACDAADDLLRTALTTHAKLDGGA